MRFAEAFLKKRIFFKDKRFEPTQPLKTNPIIKIRRDRASNRLLIGRH